MRAWLAVVWSRIRGLLSARRLDDDFGREVSAHLAMLTEQNIRRGMTPDEARRAAMVRFGGAMQYQGTAARRARPAVHRDNAARPALWHPDAAPEPGVFARRHRHARRRHRR